MGIRVRHYAAKAPGADYRLNIEAIVLELMFGIIAAAFAIGGYNAGLVLLAVPCALVALACSFLLIHSTYLAIRYKLR